MSFEDNLFDFPLQSLVTECAQYVTPIDGLYLCGAGSHPGGGVNGYAGFNAAREILKNG